MTHRTGSNLVLNIYTAFFLLIIFAPMVMMVIASFNETSPPNVMEWAGTTFKWYEYFWMSDAEIAADPILRNFDRGAFVGCAVNSLVVAAGVVPLSLLLGLAGAVFLTKLRTRFNGFVSWLLLSPMLMPGITLGLSTMIYWGTVGVNPGLFTATMAMTSFVATVPMLIIMGRLQRQDASLEEAALDLGASPTYTFWRVTLRSCSRRLACPQCWRSCGRWRTTTRPSSPSARAAPCPPISATWSATRSGIRR